eukprot:7897_1
MAEQKKDDSNALNPLFSISGVYTQSTDGKKAQVTCSSDGKIVADMSSTNRPSANGVYLEPTCIGKGQLTFPDIKQTYSYTFNGNTIRYDNNTQWVKDSIGGVYIDDSNKKITLTAEADGELIVKWNDGKRPSAYGNVNANSNTGYIRFPDVKSKYSLVFDGKVISFNNNTKWTRQ